MFSFLNNEYINAIAITPATIHANTNALPVSIQIIKQAQAMTQHTIIFNNLIGLILMPSYNYNFPTIIIPQNKSIFKVNEEIYTLYTDIYF